MKLFLGVVLIILSFWTAWARIVDRSLIGNSFSLLEGNYEVLDELNPSTQPTTTVSATNLSAVHKYATTEPTDAPAKKVESPSTKGNPSMRFITDCKTTETTSTTKNPETHNAAQSFTSHIITETTTTCRAPAKPEVTRIRVMKTNCTTLDTTESSSVVKKPTTSGTGYIQSQKSFTTTERPTTTCDPPNVSSNTSSSSNTNISITTENTTTVCVRFGVSTTFKLSANSITEVTKTICTSKETSTISTRTEKHATVSKNNEDYQDSKIGTLMTLSQNEPIPSNTENQSSSQSKENVISILDKEMSSTTMSTASEAVDVSVTSKVDDVITTTNLSTIKTPEGSPKEELHKRNEKNSFSITKTPNSATTGSPTTRITEDTQVSTAVPTSQNRYLQYISWFKAKYSMYLN